MSTVRFKLDNEQLPFPSAASIESNYEKLRARIEEKSKCPSTNGWQSPPSPGGPDSFRFGPNTETVAKKSAETSESPGSGHFALLQPNGASPGHSVSPVHQHTSPGFAKCPSQTMDSSFLHYSPTRVHPAPNYQSIHKELYNGRMERPFVVSAERQRPGGAQSGQLGCATTFDPLLLDSADTDLCLSMVNETRPSYQMKMRGKQPLTAPHLTALIDSQIKKNHNAMTPPVPAPPASYSPNRISRSAYSPTSSAYSHSQETSSAYKLSQKIAAAASSSPPSAPPPPASSSSFKFDRPKSPAIATVSPRPASSSFVQSQQTSSFDNFKKPVRTFDDFDPDDILCDLRQNSSSTKNRNSPQPPFRKSASPTPFGSSSASSRSTNIPVLVGSAASRTHSLASTNFFASPKARGLAPAPSDQPVRNPAKYGVEANIDAMTIRMMSNMQTGYGALGPNNCVKCGEGIFPERPGCVALNKTYHADCFTCSTCKCRLSGAPFYAVDEKHYCEKDYLETLEKCANCQKTIKDRILRAGGRAYHPQCFTCVSCFRQLDGTPFTVDANNQNYCLQCFHEKFAPRCASCHKPIAPVEGQKETTRVVAMDRSYHVECYVCEDCGMKLSSAVEGHGCYPLDNHLLCKDCNMNRLKRITAP